MVRPMSSVTSRMLAAASTLSLLGFSLFWESMAVETVEKKFSTFKRKWKRALMGRFKTLAGSFPLFSCYIVYLGLDSFLHYGTVKGKKVFVESEQIFQIWLELVDHITNLILDTSLMLWCWNVGLNTCQLNSQFIIKISFINKLSVYHKNISLINSQFIIKIFH